jgi:hypothetical protein
MEAVCRKRLELVARLIVGHHRVDVLSFHFHLSDGCRVGRNPQIVAPDGGGGDGTVIASDTQSHLFQSGQGAVLFKSARRRLDPKSTRSRNDGIDSFRTGGDEASHPCLEDATKLDRITWDVLCPA